MTSLHADATVILMIMTIMIIIVI